MKANNALITVEEFRQKYFAKGSAPAAITVRRWIKSGKLSGQIYGRSYYVDSSQIHNNTGNPLVDHVLRAS